MKPAEKLSGRIGTYSKTSVGGEEVRAYVPAPLPPEPPLELSALYDKLEAANRSLGRLDGTTSILPDPPLFLYMYVRKEALLSAQIEGTQSSLSDLMMYENGGTPGVPLDDVKEVSNYVAAMDLGIQRLREGLPLSNRLIRELHKILLRDGRGQTKSPGEFRRSQNWLGGTRPGNAAFVPPPPNLVAECMSDLEKYIHSEADKLPLLVRAALVHVQFETIHPFLDGNGRLGRLLITLMLVANSALQQPMLYLSLYFKTYRQHYYEMLQRVRTEGDWEGWLDFFLEGVRETSNQAADTAKKIIALFEADRKRIEKLGRPAGSALQVHQYLQTKPVVSVPTAAKALSLSAPTVRKSINHLVELEILSETTGKQRDRVFAYKAYMKTLSEGTEPLS